MSNQATIRRTPLTTYISDDFPGPPYAAVKHGMRVRVVAPTGNTVWVKEVWQRGTWLPWRPRYAQRLAKALAKAERVCEVLNGG